MLYARRQTVYPFKQVQLAPQVRQQVEGVFFGQAKAFYNGIGEEVPFDPSWRLDPNQLFSVGLTDDAAEVLDTLAGNPLDIEPVNVGNLAAEGIAALLVCDDGNERVLIQGFTLAQRLDTKFTLAFDGNVFRKFEDAAFTISTALSIVMQGDAIKFKSFQKLRSIFDMRETYLELTNEEVLAFVDHDSLFVDNRDAFVAHASEPIRKLIQSVRELGVLDNFHTRALQQLARESGLAIDLQDDRLVLPAGFRELRDVLRFLNDDRFRGTLSGEIYVTNSKTLAHPIN